MNENKLKDNKIHILGAGPSGMSAAYYAHKNKIPFHLFESTDKVGGNAKTLSIGEFMFDTGAHRLHNKNKIVTQDIKNILNNEINLVSAPSKIFYDDKFIDFPIRAIDIIKKLDLKTNFKIILEKILNTFLINKNIDNFKDLSYRNYGQTLSELFLINYTEKLWGEAAEVLDTSISGGRLNNLDIYTVINELITGKISSNHIDGSFLYPKYGFGSIFTSINKLINKHDISFNCPIKKLIHHNGNINKIVLKNNREVKVKNVISTLPISVLINGLYPSPPNNIKEIVNRIRYRGLKLFILFLNKKKFSSYASIYFPQKEMIFTRIYEPKNRSKLLAPKNKTCIVIEVPDDNDNIYDKNSNKKIYKSIKSTLINKNLISENDIIDYKIISMPYAYPILKTNNQLSEVLMYIKKLKNLYLLGRSAEFKYLHIHDLFSKSDKMIRKILGN